MILMFIFMKKIYANSKTKKNRLLECLLNSVIHIHMIAYILTFIILSVELNNKYFTKKCYQIFMSF